MALHIKAPETIRLVEELARRTGESPESAVQTAVRERLARLRTPEEEQQRRERLEALVESLAARFKASGQPLVDHGELLYGDDGLPREGDLSAVKLSYYFPERYPPATDR
jgi:hypothetical protein